MNLLNFFFITIIISSLSYGQGNLKYYLNNSSIESVAYKLAPDSTYSIFIKLNKKETKEFEKLTKNNIDNLLNIYKNNYLIQEAVIKTSIPNGLISINNLKNSNEVLHYIKILLE